MVCEVSYQHKKITAGLLAVSDPTANKISLTASRNWLTLLAKHDCSHSDSNVPLLSISINDTEINNSVWQAMMASFAGALSFINIFVISLLATARDCYGYT